MQRPALYTAQYTTQPRPNGRLVRGLNAELLRQTLPPLPVYQMRNPKWRCVWPLGSSFRRTMVLLDLVEAREQEGGEARVDADADDHPELAFALHERAQDSGVEKTEAHEAKGRVRPVTDQVADPQTRASHVAPQTLFTPPSPAQHAPTEIHEAHLLMTSLSGTMTPPVTPPVYIAQCSFISECPDSPDSPLACLRRSEKCIRSGRPGGIWCREFMRTRRRRARSKVLSGTGPAHRLGTSSRRVYGRDYALARAEHLERSAPSAGEAVVGTRAKTYTHNLVPLPIRLQPRNHPVTIQLETFTFPPFLNRLLHPIPTINEGPSILGTILSSVNVVMVFYRRPYLYIGPPLYRQAHDFTSLTSSPGGDYLPIRGTGLDWDVLYAVVAESSARRMGVVDRVGYDNRGPKRTFPETAEKSGPERVAATAQGKHKQRSW
ncbi:hypothetical protein FIBSPDRAFT_904147 [Athelia psychrophila]|uniref:Uncharacterized protein n=1 Tax=Athelia psychrophila TaxID=1759441 RepID=A0A167V3W2_9AGAM|nr:hypothetical protein FIBSPDRAFT_904147 [Fibularhizoctonia sp. CBS 109695]